MHEFFFKPGELVQHHTNILKHIMGALCLVCKEGAGGAACMVGFKKDSYDFEASLLARLKNALMYQTNSIVS